MIPSKLYLEGIVLANVELVCPTCERLFLRAKNMYDYRQRNGSLSFCSTKCQHGYKSKMREISLAYRIMLINQYLDYFEANTIRSEDPDKCWGWLPGNWPRYPTLSVFARPIHIHIFSYFIHKGDISEGLVVRHSCHNMKCSNPNHLSLGTHKDNSQDMVEAGRQSKGVKNGWSSINDHIAGVIKYLYFVEKMRIVDINKRLGVSTRTISTVVNNRNWIWVETPSSITEDDISLAISSYNKRKEERLSNV